MDRRRHRRSKRRLPCEFQHEGHRYRGIAVNTSRSGLFIQTNATLDPGAELEIELRGGRVLDVSLRAVVIRRRAPPAILASVIRPGLGLQILEAPDAYFELLGVKKLAEEVTHSVPDWDNLDIEIVVDPDAGWKPPAAPHPGPPASTPEIFEETEPEELFAAAASCHERDPAASAETEGAADEPTSVESDLADDAGAWPPETLHRSYALVIDDGELDDVYAMLEALGTDPLRDRAVGEKGFRDWEQPPRVVVISAGLAVRLTVGTRARDSGIVTIAVAEEGSQTLCAMLRRQGFEYVVRRPVHPEALRLLLIRALYRGSERRSQARLPVGCEVIARWGIRRHPATLLEISSSGCSFLGREAPKPGRRISVRIPCGAIGERGLKLRGRVQRSERQGRIDAEAGALVALAFDPLSPRTRNYLEKMVAASVTGPRVFSRAGGQTSLETRGSTPEAGADDLADAPWSVPRRHPRATVDHEAVVLDAQLERARHVLFARDLSVGGARVEPHPGVKVGDRFKLALYDDTSPDPVVVAAQVLRDDGNRGLALRFLHTPAGAARRIERILERAGEIEQCDARDDAHQVIVTEMVQEEHA